MEEQKTKKKRDYKKEEKYKWRSSVALTPSEGTLMVNILEQFSCSNLSQLCKRITRGEIILSIDEDVAFENYLKSNHSINEKK